MNRWAAAIANSAPQLADYPPILLGVAPSPNHKGSIMNQITKELELVLSAIGRHIDDYQHLEWMELYQWIEDIMLLSSNAIITILEEEE